jgi:hypothetical protein
MWTLRLKAPKIPAMWLIVLGLASVCVSMVFDTLVRLRLSDAGGRRVFLHGTLDYGLYLRLRRDKRWSPWPVYLIVPFLLFGIGCIIFGLVRT